MLLKKNNMKNKIFLFVLFGAFGFAVFALYTNVSKAKSILNNYTFYSSEKNEPQQFILANSSSSTKRVKRPISNPSNTYIVAEQTPAASSAHPASARLADNSFNGQSGNGISGNVSRVNDNNSASGNLSITPIALSGGSKSKPSGSDVAASSGAISAKSLAPIEDSPPMMRNSVDPGTPPTNPIPLGNDSWTLLSLALLYTLFMIKKRVV